MAFCIIWYNFFMLVDTHCHLHDPEWFTPEQAKNALLDAAKREIRQIICIGTYPEDSLNARDFAAAHQNIYWTFGIHPEFADKYGSGDDGVLAALAVIELASTGGRGSESLDEESVPLTDKVAQTPIAIGEIGLDYHYDSSSRKSQIHLFEQMLQLAKDLSLPVSLHVREAFFDLWPVLDNFPKIRGVVHSFTGSKRDLAEALRREFYIGVNGLITYTTTPLPPLEKMLLETDAPFLTPYHNRDTMNVPGNVREIAAFLSGKMGVAETIIAEQTTHNATQLFGIKFTGDGFFTTSDPAR